MLLVFLLAKEFLFRTKNTLLEQALMRNLILMTFVTMGLLFSSCSAFNLIQAGHADSEFQTLKISDYFNCEFQVVGDADTLFYTHTEKICAERDPVADCFMGNSCTHSTLVSNHKILYGEDEIGFYVNFSYDHFFDSQRQKAMLYFCDQSVLSVSTDLAKKDFYKDECLPPQLGAYDVPLQKLEAVQIPGFIDSIFQSHFRLSGGEIFQVFCEHQNTEVGTGCR